MRFCGILVLVAFCLISFIQSQPASASEKVCTLGICTIYVGANHQGSAKDHVVCPKGQFLDPRNGGECWSCPANFKRTTTEPVTSKRACNKPAN